MKTTLSHTHLIILVTGAVLLAACQNNPQAGSLSAIFEILSADQLPEQYRSLLPAGMPIPDSLPKTILDPHLLAAWVYLYNQAETITVQDGISWTGRSLAESVIERVISISWDADNRCNGSSCSFRKICTTLDCVASYERDTEYPIYMGLHYQEASAEMLAKLAGSMAHELYHHTLPFGSVDSSLFEEYFSFYVGASISGNTWLDFEGYNPLSPACLKMWFRMNNKSDYFGIDEYPLTISPLAEAADQLCER